MDRGIVIPSAGSKLPQNLGETNGGPVYPRGNIKTTEQFPSLMVSVFLDTRAPPSYGAFGTPRLACPDNLTGPAGRVQNLQGLRCPECNQLESKHSQFLAHI